MNLFRRLSRLWQRRPPPVVNGRRGAQLQARRHVVSIDLGFHKMDDAMEFLKLTGNARTALALMGPEGSLKTAEVAEVTLRDSYAKAMQLPDAVLRRKFCLVLTGHPQLPQDLRIACVRGSIPPTELSDSPEA